MHTHTCTTFRQQQALPQWFQVRTVHTSHPLHAEETVNVTRKWVSEWVSEWVVRISACPHVRMSVCVRDSQLCRSVIIHHQRNRQIYAFLIMRERKRRGGDSVQCCCRSQCDKQRSFLVSLMGPALTASLLHPNLGLITPLGLISAVRAVGER
jgi:hypothetical protein